ncbi:asparagine-linked glycosylation protein [Ceratobasidium sp. 414]|nr:asparagine-linked glycosylation protein [Ceratobasidium sp. 414]
MGLLESLLQVLAVLCGSGKPGEGQQQQQQPSAWQKPPHQPHPHPQSQPWQHPYPPQQKPSKPYHARIDDNAQAQANPHYQQLRSRAREEGDAMARAFDASHAAYDQGDGAEAKRLSDEGKRHKAEMERLDKEAGDWIFQQVNMDSAPDELDLHGLYVKEAVARTESAVLGAQRRGDSQIKIIVGKGLHSQGQVAKLKPAIEGLMVKYQLNAHIDPQNAGVLVVQLGGRGERGMDPNEVTRRLETGEHNSGGGGERVLWTAIAYLQRTDSHVFSVVYTGDTDATKEEIISKVKTRFDITLDPESLEFVFLQTRWLVEDSTWPRFTLLGQSLGSMGLVYEAVCGVMPDLFIDTMGYAFTFHAVRWLSQGRTPVSAYVHYPTISTDMLARVKSRASQYNNASGVANSTVRTYAKLIYYNLFAMAYSMSLHQAQTIMVNSSWTKSHVDYLLNHSSLLLSSSGRVSTIVYPPCDTKAMSAFPLENREKIIMSLAQFRPEKDQAKQIHSLAQLFESHPEHRSQGVRLVLLGSSRNAADAERIVTLQNLVAELKLEDSVEFVVNASYDVVLSWLARASIGTNTMVDEHFGINVVEFMAAGLIPIVHASGGPLNDIVIPYNDEPTGYHATDWRSFADAFHKVLSLPAAEVLSMRQRARALAVERFSTDEFELGWARGWEAAVQGVESY